MSLNVYYVYKRFAVHSVSVDHCARTYSLTSFLYTFTKFNDRRITNRKLTSLPAAGIAQSTISCAFPIHSDDISCDQWRGPLPWRMT